MKIKFLQSVINVILLVLLSGSIYAQNLVTNGDLESWVDDNNPTYWDHAENITKEATLVYEGSFSAKQESASGTKDFGHEDIIGIVAGNEYTISYYYYDNDVAARTRIWAKWLDDGGVTVGTTIEGEYSVDIDEWQHYNEVFIAPDGATQFYLEIRVYKQDGVSGGFVYYDNFEMTGGGVAVLPPVFDPAGGLYFDPVNVEMTSASVGATIYYTMDGSEPTTGSTVYTAPVAIAETATLKALAELGGDESSITTAEYVINNDVVINHETFIVSLGTWTPYSVIGDQEWEYADGYGNPPGCAKCSGYDGVAVENEDWLISPSLDFSTTSGEKFSFESAVGYPEDNSIALKISSDYTGSGDPTAAVWEDLTVSQWATTWSFEPSGDVDLSTYDGTVYLAFVYYSTAAAASTWEVDNLLVSATSGTPPADVRVVGSMQGWNTTDPDYIMNMTPYGTYSLTKTLDAAGSPYEYKALEGDDWADPNYPVDNQVIELTAPTAISWFVNTEAELIYHQAPIVAGDFLEVLGVGNNWDPTNVGGLMSDDDNDQVWTLELIIPEGTYSAKVTLNGNWNQNTTGANVPFTTDGINATTFTYDFPNNIVTISGPPPPSATVTFIIDDTEKMAYDIFYLKGSISAEGAYDPTWNGGEELSQLFDDGTNGDAVAGDHIWTYQMDLVSDGGSNTWEWGVNGPNHEWVEGNWQFQVIDGTPFTLSQTLSYTLPDVVINEIMYNPPEPHNDDYHEFLELYNPTNEDIALGGYYLSAVEYEFEADFVLTKETYLVLAKNADTIMEYYGISDVITWTSGGLTNNGETVQVRNATGAIVDAVAFDDAAPWPTTPDGDGPSLSLISPTLDNALPENWLASFADMGTPQAVNFTAPVADFVASNTAIMNGESIDFTDLSENATSWVWTFEGGTPESSTEQNPTGIQYNNTGNYDVTLVVTNFVGEDELLKVEYIAVTSTPPPPGTYFEADVTEIFIGETVNFSDYSTNNPTAWEWVFEGATPATSSLQDPQDVQYTTVGSFDVELTATNTYGSSSLLIEEYIVVSNIVPDFSADNTTGFEGDVINFTNSSLGNNLTYSWTFEGGTPATSTDENPSVTYNTEGVYDVTLSITNGYATEELIMEDYIDIDPVGVERNQNSAVTIYPNPTTGMVVVKGYTLGSTIEIYNTRGQQILQQVGYQPQLELDLTAVEKGIYFVKMTTVNEMKLKKLIIK